MARSGRKSTTARAKKSESGKSAFASPREKSDFQKKLDDERKTSTIISNRQRKLNELGITVGVGQSSADVSGGSVAGTTSSPATASTGASSSSGASGTASPTGRR